MSDDSTEVITFNTFVTQVIGVSCTESYSAELQNYLLNNFYIIRIRKCKSHG